MAGGGKETAARQSRPEGVLSGEKLECGGEPEVEYRELVGRGGHRRNMVPAAGYLAQDHRKTEDRSENVEVHLNDIGPDHRRHSALERVKKREGDNQYDCGGLAHAQHHRNHDGDGGDAYPFGQSSRHQEYRGGQLANALAESPPHQFVGGEHLAPEILRQEKDRNHDAGQQIAEDQLQKPQVAREGERRCADDRQGAGLGRDDRQANSPPGRAPAAQEVVAQALLAATEPRSEPGDAHQVGQDYRQIEVMHEGSVFQHTADLLLFVIRNLAIRNGVE
jgi:hypothetical protein